MDGWRHLRHVEANRREGGAARLQPGQGLRLLGLVGQVQGRAGVPRDGVDVGALRDQVLGRPALAVEGGGVERREVVRVPGAEKPRFGVDERTDTREVPGRRGLEDVLRARRGRSRGRRRRDPQAGERPVGPVADEECDAAALRLAQVLDGQARLRRPVHVHLDPPPGEDDARVEPAVGIGGRVDRLLELAGPLGAQPLPRVGGVRDVLDRVGPPLRLGGPEVERAEVDRVERRPVDDVERDAEEAPLGHVLALQVDLDHPFAELDPVQQDAPVARPRVEPDDGVAVLRGHGERAVEDLRAPPVGEPREVRRHRRRRLGRAVARARDERHCRQDQSAHRVHGPFRSAVVGIWTR